MQRRTHLFTMFCTLVALLVATQILFTSTSLAREKEAGDDRGRHGAEAKHNDDHGRGGNQPKANDDRGRGGNHTEAGDDHGRSGNHTEAGDDRGRGGNHTEPGDDRGGVPAATDGAVGTPVTPPCMIIEPGDDTPQPCPVVPSATPITTPAGVANDDHGRHHAL